MHAYIQLVDCFNLKLCYNKSVDFWQVGNVNNVMQISFALGKISL